MPPKSPTPQCVASALGIRSPVPSGEARRLCVSWQRRPTSEATDKSVRPTRASLPSQSGNLVAPFPLWASAVETLVNRQKLHERPYPLSSMDNINFEIVSHLPSRIAII